MLQIHHASQRSSRRVLLFHASCLVSANHGCDCWSSFVANATRRFTVIHGHCRSLWGCPSGNLSLKKLLLQLESNFNCNLKMEPLVEDEIPLEFSWLGWGIGLLKWKAQATWRMFRSHPYNDLACDWTQVSHRTMGPKIDWHTTKDFLSVRILHVLQLLKIKNHPRRYIYIYIYIQLHIIKQNNPIGPLHIDERKK